MIRVCTDEAAAHGLPDPAPPHPHCHYLSYLPTLNQHPKVLPKQLEAGGISSP